MVAINYESDFKITEVLEFAYKNIPFEFEYTTPHSDVGVKIEFDGTDLTGNVTKVNATKFNVFFYDHGLKPGILHAKRIFHVPDTSYPDNVRKVVFEDDIAVLVEGNGDTNHGIAMTKFYKA